LLGREEIVLVASPEHRFADLACVPLAELATEPLVHYHPDNGFAIWVDQFAAEQGVVLPQPALRTGFPRTAAQLAAAGMGVTIVPYSALTPLPGATIRSLDPPVLRDVIVTVAAPHDDLLRRFTGDLMRRGLPESRLPESRLPQPGRPGPLADLVRASGPVGATVMTRDAYPVAAYPGRAP
jgi:DNA-binding transcriptional LysR family regulator